MVKKIITFQWKLTYRFLSGQEAYLSAKQLSQLILNCITAVIHGNNRGGSQAVTGTQGLPLIPIRRFHAQRQHIAYPV